MRACDRRSQEQPVQQSHEDGTLLRAVKRALMFHYLPAGVMILSLSCLAPIATSDGGLQPSLPTASRSPASVELADLDGSNGFVLNGISADGFSGTSVSRAGDMNGDGFDDVIIGADGADPGGRSRAGASYVVFGTDQGYPASWALSSLDGSSGFALKGVDVNDGAGESVSSAGDVNGDGFDDIIIGAHDADPGGRNNAGETYVVFGTDQGHPPSLELSALDGTNGFVLNGIVEFDFSGSSVSGAGDVNGDGFDDVIIGAHTADPIGDNEGETYIVFGTDQGFAPVLELLALDGSNGFTIIGIDADDLSGKPVSGAGDVNGDGIDDVIIGAVGADPNGNQSGESYVVFGTDQGFAATLALSTLDGSNGFVLNGIDAFDAAGHSVSGAGDVNGDGIDDLIIGAREASTTGDQSGESYVVFGTDQGFAATLELSALDGNNGFVLNGINNSDYSGFSVSGADLNGDGLGDLIIGAPDAFPNGVRAGESYVVFGSDQGFAATFELSALDGSNGFVLNGIDANDETGHSVSGAGDVNGDGIDDQIIGAHFADPNGGNRAGESYVVFGSPPPDIDVSPTDVAFPDTLSGDQSVEQVTVANRGDADLILGQVALADPADAPFSIELDDCSFQTLAPAANCAVTVGFLPAVAGEFTDSFDIPSSDAVAPNVTVALAGTGLVLAPDIDVGSGQIWFGSVQLGQSESRDLSVSNVGTVDLVIASVGVDDPLAAPFAVTIDGCSGQTLQPGANCTLDVGFAPQTAGVFMDSVSVASNDPIEPLVSVSVRGRTTPQPIVLSIEGANGGSGTCENLQSGAQARKVLFGATVLDCEAAGLSIPVGVAGRVSIVAQVDDSAAPIAGNVSGLGPTLAVCRNVTSGNRVVIPLSDGATAWDCTAAGLAAGPGDKVLLVVRGTSI